MWIDNKIFVRNSEPVALEVWCPDDTIVVLGRSNSFVTECYQEACKQDQIQVLRRSGGGGAVVLHKGCIVVSLGLWVQDYFRNDYYFDKTNQAIIATLEQVDPAFRNLYQDGISDICYEGKKIAGTSLFRSRNYLLYQASLLYSTNHSLIGRYLRHPSKEPAYRKKKAHSEFLSALEEITSDSSQEKIQNFLRNNLQETIKIYFSKDLIMPQKEQFSSLVKKFQIDKENSLGSLT